MSDFQFQIVIAGVGPRPPFRDVVEHVYGIGTDVDTMGDSHPPERTDWTWLCMSLRPTSRDLPDVEVSMSVDQPTCMIVLAHNEELATRTAAFLALRTGGIVLA
jgi:hypothetical protein